MTNTKIQPMKNKSVKRFFSASKEQRESRSKEKNKEKRIARANKHRARFF